MFAILHPRAIGYACGEMNKYRVLFAVFHFLFGIERGLLEARLWKYKEVGNHIVVYRENVFLIANGVY